MTATMYFLLCAGFPLILIGGVWWLTILIFLMRTKETTGRIVSIETSSSNRGRSTRSKTLAEFQTADGNTVQFTESTGRSMGFFEFFILIPVLIVRYLYQKAFSAVTGVTYDGDAVQILYDPKDPNRAHINNFHYLHGRPLSMMMLGIWIGMGAIPAVFSFYSKIGEFLNKFFSWL